MDKFFPTYIPVAKNKTEAKPWQTLISAVSAGAFIALGGIVSQTANIAAGEYGKLTAAVTFPIGLLLVLIFGSDLFTGNCLLLLPLTDREITPGRTLRNLVLSYIGNIIGAVAVALLVYACRTPSAELQSLMISAAEAKCALSPITALMRGIMCNILVCLAVAGWIKTKRITVMFAPIFLFVLCGFEHIVANFYYFTVALLYGAEINFAVNLIFVTLGNIIGGAAVAMLLKAMKRYN